MSELKELLKELQATDTELHAQIKRKEEIPKKIGQLEAEIAELHRRFDETKNSLTESRKELKFVEMNLNSQEELVNKYNSQLYSAKTNEEYKAFLKEIETANRKKTEFEDQIIGIMERIEQEEAELKKRETERDENETKMREEIKQVQSKEAELEEKLVKIRDKYERLRNEMPEDMIEIYDRIRKNKSGIAVAQVQDGVRCSVCLNPVPAQEAIEAAHTERLIFCEYCGRILLP
ncbi:hypothetical protein JXM67_02345 [candidate division WOR-3 bacterium]|nr:hypothetical protein [candidate division WOR-3 bacterium]